MLNILVLLACGSGVSVTVVNQTEAPLTDVVVSVTGAEQALGTVPPGGQQTVRVAPTGESSVTVSGDGFSEGAGYIEAGYRGSMTFALRPGGEVAVTDETRLPWP